MKEGEKEEKRVRNGEIKKGKKMKRKKKKTGKKKTRKKKKVENQIHLTSLVLDG